jgi:RNA 3'-terminal phosphate cyclase
MSWMQSICIQHGPATTLADQLLLPLARSSHTSVLRTSEVTLHLLTNAEVVRKFLPADISIDGELGRPATVRVVAGQALAQ